MVETIQYLVQNMKTVIVVIFVISQKTILFCLNVKLYELPMNSVVILTNVNTIFIVGILMLGLDHYTIFGKIKVLVTIRDWSTMVL